jgi:hypothetical protein
MKRWREYDRYERIGFVIAGMVIFAVAAARGVGLI